jgi:hypothetical protein
MTLLTDLERLSAELKRNKWLRYSAIFCRIVLYSLLANSWLLKSNIAEK